MKKIIPFVMLSGIIAMTACGNKTTSNATQQDSVATTDSVAATDSVTNDSLNTAEQTGKAAEQTIQAKTAAKSIDAGGTTITVGAPLAKTLKKAKDVTFDYNADYGVSAVIGNKVIIEIPDEDITKEGIDFVNTILADISPNIDFKISYIKPSAKIKDFEKSSVKLQ